MKRNLPGRLESAYASPCQPKLMLCSGENKDISFLSQLKSCTRLPIQRGKPSARCSNQGLVTPSPYTSGGKQCSLLPAKTWCEFLSVPYIPTGLRQDSSRESLGSHAPQHKACPAQNDTLLTNTARFHTVSFPVSELNCIEDSRMTSADFGGSQIQP